MDHSRLQAQVLMAARFPEVAYRVAGGGPNKLTLCDQALEHKMIVFFASLGVIMMLMVILFLCALQSYFKRRWIEQGRLSALDLPNTDHHPIEDRSRNPRHIPESPYRGRDPPRYQDTRYPEVYPPRPPPEHSRGYPESVALVPLNKALSQSRTSIYPDPNLPLFPRK